MLHNFYESKASNMLTTAHISVGLVFRMGMTWVSISHIVRYRSYVFGFSLLNLIHNNITWNRVRVAHHRL